MRNVVVVSLMLAVASCSPSAPPAPAAQAPLTLRFAYDGDGLWAFDVFAARRVFSDDGAVADAPDGPDLSRWFAVEVAPDDVDAVSAQLLAQGASDVDVEPAFVPAVLEGTGLIGKNGGQGAQDDSCPIRTPPYDDRQGYLAAIRSRTAWALPGGRGQGVQVADVEGDWNATHEDLPPLKHVAGKRQGRGWSEHGTAVLGVVAGKDNGIGVTGIAPDVALLTSSLGGIGAARALHEAAKALRPGDILIVELHGPGPNHKGRGQQGFVPMEWWGPEYDAIRWATAKGVIVVEAAGNGSEDLDAKVYRGKFDRNVRDSGAILVGAGASDVDESQPSRSRLFFSNHGSRVDVQGWGYQVATLDYGDLQGCAAANRKYTARFSGTSSASPVVAGAAAVVQGVYRANTQTFLTSPQMRALLTTTGTPQTSAPRAPLSQHIGPLPDVERALAALAPQP